jgi:serine protease Do
VDSENEKMKNGLLIRAISIGSGILLGSAVVAWALWPFDGRGTSGPQVRISTEPLSRETRLTTSFAPVVKKVAPSVVNIYTTRTVRGPRRDPMFEFFFGMPRLPQGPRQQEGLGSGVIVSSDGYVLTNHHVIEGVDGIRIRLSDDQQTEYPAKVVGSDAATDIAVLKVEAENLPAATLGESGQAEVGDLVLAIGNPFNIGQTVTVGIISAKGRQLPFEAMSSNVVAYQDFIQTDASINPGNSGGALVDAEGRVIGINTAIFSQSGGSMGLGFAVPINLAREVMTQLISKGRVARGFLGVEIQPVDADLASSLGLREQAGVLITGVTPGSAADVAGLKRRDVVLAFNGEKVSDLQEFRFKVARVPPGEEATVRIWRDKKEREIKVKLQDRDEAVIARVRPQPEPTVSVPELFSGLQLEDLTPETARQFNLPADSKGPIVTAVDPNSPAARAQIQPGDILLEVADQPVANVRDFQKVTAGIQGDKVLLFMMRNGNGRYVILKGKSPGAP